MKLKKITALLLSIVMTASLLAGCGSSSGEGGSEAATETEETAKAGESNADKAAGEAKTE